MAVQNLEQKLAQIVEKKISPWKQEAEWRRENRNWLRMSAQIALLILDKLDELGWTQKFLAEKMSVSPQQISKIVKGHENLTLQTIANLEKVLGIQISLHSTATVANTFSPEIHYTQSFQKLLSNFKAKIDVKVNNESNEIIVDAKESIAVRMAVNVQITNTVKKEAEYFAMGA